ncbi:hypothetical protein ACIA5D_06515 [Actinoplanes sp. NPDC051513]|uniref:hypothetical protein n=1 Tax=Actinoplanes sp. NPDC051513 TaxID=3363908 RepID=UPI00378F1961
MQPRDDRDRDVAGLLSARLQTLIGAARKAADFAALRDDARRQLGPDHEITLEIEYAWESRRDAGRSAVDSLPVWAGLRQRAEKSLPPGSVTAVAIRSRHLRQLRGCGRPGDLDVLVGLCREEIERCAGDPDPRRLGEARADLAWVLRDRAWFAGYHREAAGGEAARDLAEASALIDGEVRRLRSAAAPDQVSATACRRIQAEVLLALGRDAPAAAARARDIAEDLVGLDDSEDDDGRTTAVFDQLPGSHVLLAEALLLTGRVSEAGRVARLAYALHTGARVFDPARPLLVLARSEARAGRPDAGETARAALRQRLETFPADSHYVAEARRLAEELPP